MLTFRRGIDDDPIDEVIRLDESWRQIRYEVDQLRKEKNSAARGIASAKKSGDEDEFKRIMDQVSNLGEMIENLESDARKTTRNAMISECGDPNILHPDVPVGKDDQKNVEISRHGSERVFSFNPKTHNEIIEEKWVGRSRSWGPSCCRNAPVLPDRRPSQA